MPSSLAPLRAQITFNSPVVYVGFFCGFFFVLDVFSILTTTTKSLQLYHFLQAVVRPCKAASGVEMVHRQCQQGEEGAARERLGREVHELLPALPRAAGVRKCCEVLLVGVCCFTSSCWSCWQGQHFSDSITCFVIS